MVYCFYDIKIYKASLSLKFMASTKQVAATIPEIESALKSFSGDMVRIEYLENCLKQLGLANDVSRFCHLKLADLYAYKLMWNLAAKNMDNAADKATTYKDKLNYYLKEIDFLVNSNDYLMMDKAFKKAILCGSTPQEKENIKLNLKGSLLRRAAEFEAKNKRSSAALIYEKLLDMNYLLNDEERKQLMGKIAAIFSKIGRIKDAMRYEQMMTRPIEHKRSNDPDENIRKISLSDLGIEEVF